MTAIIEDFIDSLKLENGDSDAGVPANASPIPDAARTLSSTLGPVKP